MAVTNVEEKAGPTPPDYVALVRRMLAAVESVAIDEYLGYFAPDAEYKIGNADALIGTEKIRGVAAGVVQTMGGITHDVKKIWAVDGGTVLCHADVTYRRKDGKEFRIPNMVIVRFRDDKVRSYQAYLDAAPAFAPTLLDRVMAMETAASRGDWDQFRSSLTEDVFFVVGSVSEVTGPQAVADYYRKTQTGDHQITCADIRGSWELDNVVIIEMDVHARRAGDGKTVSYPSVGTFRFRGDKVHKWRTYPVYPSFIKDDRQF